MPNLISLNCYNCTNLKDEGLATVIQSSEVLKTLDIIHTKFTANLIRAAVIATSKRRSNVVLVITMDDTNVHPYEVENTSSFLELDVITFFADD